MSLLTEAGFVIAESAAAERSESIADAIAALPKLTDHEPYAELLERRSALAAEEAKVRGEIAAVVREMNLVSGDLTTLRTEDLEAVRLAGLDIGHMEHRAELVAKKVALEKKAADLSRAQQLLTPELERARRDATVKADAVAYEFVLELSRDVANYYLAFVNALLDLRQMHQAIRDAKLAGGKAGAIPFPVEDMLRAGRVGLSAGPKAVVRQLGELGVITREEALEVIIEMRARGLAG